MGPSLSFCFLSLYLCIFGFQYTSIYLSNKKKYRLNVQKFLQVLQIISYKVYKLSRAKKVFPPTNEIVVGLLKLVHPYKMNSFAMSLSYTRAFVVVII